MAFNLMGLPAEVRILIYKQCLPVSNDLVLKPTACENEEIAGRILEANPVPALFQVSKDVGAGAAAVFYGKNTWSIPDIPQGLRLPAFFIKHVRNATVMFDRRLLKIDDLWEISDQSFDNRKDSYSRLEETHDKLKHRLLASWKKKCRVLGKLDLKELEVDFTHAKCPLGCCRMFQEAFKLLTKNVILERRKITPVGMIYEHEAVLVHDADMRCESCFRGPERLAASAGYCWRSVLPDEH